MSDTEEEKVFEVDVAQKGRAGCKKCKQKCLQGELRIAKIVPNPFADGKMKNWHHVDCLFDIFKKQRATTKRIETVDDLAGFDYLSSDLKQVINDKIDQANQLAGITPKTPTKVKKNKAKLKPAKQNDLIPNLDNLFETFQCIVEKVAKYPSYLEKTGIIKIFFKNGADGTTFKGDIEIWCRLLLPGSVKRIYNLQNKQLVKLFSKIFVEDQDEMLEHLEQG